MAEQGATPDIVELVRQSYDAYNRRDVDAWLSLLSPDIVYRPVPTFTDSQERRGHDAMRRFIHEFFDAWANDACWHIDTARVYGDAVVVLLRFTGHAKASGAEVSGAIFEIVRFRDGKITRIEDFTDRADALKAAGVSE